MEYEGSSPRNPRKRSRSPSEIGIPATDNNLRTVAEADDQLQYVRQPKRRRKNRDIPEYHAPVDEHVLKSMERSNPLNRKNLRREAKKARKVQKAKMVAERATAEEMVIDPDDLQFTFMA